MASSQLLNRVAFGATAAGALYTSGVVFRDLADLSVSGFTFRLRCDSPVLRIPPLQFPSILMNLSGLLFSAMGAQDRPS